MVSDLDSEIGNSDSADGVGGGEDMVLESNIMDLWRRSMIVEYSINDNNFERIWQ